MIRHSLPVLFLLGVMCFSHIHQGSIAADAVRYAYIAYHIVVSGDWISLYDARTESLYVNKPPLLFWLLAVCYKLFGFSTFIAKLPSAIFAFFAVYALWLCARRFYGEKAALITVILFTASRPFVRDIVDLSFDGLALLGGVLCLHASLELTRRVDTNDSSPVPLRLWTVTAAGVFCILESKMPYLAFAAFPIGMTLLRRRALVPVLLDVRLYAALAPVAAFAVWWFWVSGSAYLAGAAENQFVEPFTRDHTFIETELGWLKSFSMNFVPANIIGLFGLFQILRRRKAGLTASDELLLWWALPIIPIMLLAGIRPRYLLIPILPFYLLSGVHAARVCTRITEVHLRRLFTAAGCVVLALAVSGKVRFHRDDRLLAYFKSHPDQLSTETAICLSDAAAYRAERLAKNGEALLRLTYEKDFRVVPPPVLFSEKLTQSILADDACIDQLRAAGVSFEDRGTSGIRSVTLNAVNPTL